MSRNSTLGPCFDFSLQNTSKYGVDLQYFELNSRILEIICFSSRVRTYDTPCTYQDVEHRKTSRELTVRVCRSVFTSQITVEYDEELHKSEANFWLSRS